MVSGFSWMMDFLQFPLQLDGSWNVKTTQAWQLFLKLNSVISASPLFFWVKPRTFFFQRSFRLTCICGHDANEHSQQRIDGPAWRFSDDPSWRLWRWGNRLGFGRWRMRTPLFTRGFFWCTRIHQFLNILISLKKSYCIQSCMDDFVGQRSPPRSKFISLRKVAWPSHDEPGAGCGSNLQPWGWKTFLLCFLKMDEIQFPSPTLIGIWQWSTSTNLWPTFDTLILFQLLLAIFVNDLVIQFGGLNCDDWVPN